jgi:2-hydroxychromene-2-carboxylate isomerase
MDVAERLRVPLHYDFGSSLCFVAHRVLARLAPFLEDRALDLVWTPLDLSGLANWRPGAPIAPHRRDEIAQIADALDVRIRIPRRWPDSRRLGAVTVALSRRLGADWTRREPGWRERVFTAVYEQGADCADPAWLDGALRDLGVSLGPAEIADGEEALVSMTMAAADAMVTGVPTFMLGPWPLSGIHDETTLRSMLGRFADRQRRVS